MVPVRCLKNGWQDWATNRSDIEWCCFNFTTQCSWQTWEVYYPLLEHSFWHWNQDFTWNLVVQNNKPSNLCHTTQISFYIPKFQVIYMIVHQNLLNCIRNNLLSWFTLLVVFISPKYNITSIMCTNHRVFLTLESWPQDWQIISLQAICILCTYI